MKRIVYISTARRPMMPIERDAMLRGARRRNAALDVTGLLVIGGRRYLQALEGPEAAVANTFDRLKDDGRHFAIVTLIDRVIEHCAFPTWAMGYQEGGYALEGAASLPAIVADLIAPIRDETIKAYFNGFAQQHATPGGGQFDDRKRPGIDSR